METLEGSARDVLADERVFLSQSKSTCMGVVMLEEEILLELQKINKRLKKIEARTKHIEEQRVTPWQKFKKMLRKWAKKKTLFGKLLNKLIYLYRISWRYLYCLFAKRKPIQNNKIVFISHRGKQYSCNPMYICEYLLENYPGKFEIIWAFDKPKRFSYLKEKGITVVKKEGKAHLWHLMTAKIIVTNVDFYIYLPKVKGQIALDTWHGGGSYKTCGFANEQNLKKWRSRVRFKILYSKVNLYLSSSVAFTEQTIRRSRLFSGEVLEIGMPRNDILINQNRPDILNKVREYFGINEGIKILLYAPTYRSEEELAEMPSLDFERLKKTLSRRFGGEWCCLYRQHHLGKSKADYPEGVISAMNYPDMQELLYAADVLISDYSSCIWDFSLQYKPVFLYCPDLWKYQIVRDFYIPIEQWHFILTHDQDELNEWIVKFDEEEYRTGILLHHQELGSVESGRATEKVCKRICKECFPDMEEVKDGAMLK